MHIGNSIICPVTGIPMIIAAGAAIYYSFKKAKIDFKKEKIPYMSAAAAFVFALQMINFSIPQTGSSGHIIGAVLLAALLGRYIAFLAVCAILFVQAVFFNDGGLSALGCNIFNMGFLACFIVYPLIYKPLADKNKIITASILSSVIALQLGSLAAAAEAFLSGSISGNFAYFLSLMQAIHLPIGIVEGFFTAVIVLIAQKSNFTSNPVPHSAAGSPMPSECSNKLTYIFGISSFLLAGIIAQYASSKPDGLEWSLLNVSDFVVEQTQGIIFTSSQLLQSKISVLANINPVISGAAGVIIIACFMFLLGKTLELKALKINE